MGIQPSKRRVIARQKTSGRAVVLFALAIALIGNSFAVPLSAQSAAQQPAPTAQSPAAAPPSGTPEAGATPANVPAWQIAAGGHMEFDVASVKPDSADLSAANTHSNIPLGPMDSFTSTGGLLHATNYPLLIYIVFAYKPTSPEMQSITTQLPKWANTNHYDIEAHASGNPTKDQFRLMMQALLADRFKLKVHYEYKQEPVLALVIDKPGKLGPHFQLHPADAACSTATPAGGPNATIAGGFPEQCGVLSINPALSSGRITVGGRNVPLAMLANMLGSQPMLNINRPVIDKTGITGTVDFTMEFAPEVPPGMGFTPDPTAPTFLEALKDQLGIKLDQQTAPVESIVIDHVEEPSEN
jgi:uncharacterized protein (TIGR03435 family)